MEEGRFLLFVAVGLRRWALGGGAYILASIPALRAVHGKKRHCLLEFLLNVCTQTTVLASRRARH
jgi:hypothetical protein